MFLLALTEFVGLPEQMEILIALSVAVKRLAEMCAMAAVL
jgi:hypothetical protein